MSFSLLSTAILLLFVIGEESRIGSRELLGLILFPFGVIVGFAVGWWK